MINAIFGWPLGWLMWICFKIVPIYALALILFTLLTRAALLPLSIKQQKSMVKMQIFRPKMMELQKKYANNREKMSEELNKLYQQEGYNPMSGCLPMVIQLPVLLGLYDVIQNPLTHLLRLGSAAIEQATAIAQAVLVSTADMTTSLFSNVSKITQSTAGLMQSWYNPGGVTFDLSRGYGGQISIIDAVAKQPDAFSGLGDFVTQVQALDFTFGPFDLTQQPSFAHIDLLWIIPVLSMLTSFLLSRVTMRQSQASMGEEGASMAGMNKSMMIMMPLMSGYIAFIAPAGLGVYWVISNLLMMLQTHLLYKYMNPKEMAEKAMAEERLKKEQERKEKIEERKRLKAQGIDVGEVDVTKAMTQKEINRIKLAAARKRDAEKYGEEYVEVTDDDLR